MHRIAPWLAILSIACSGAHRPPAPRPAADPPEGTPPSSQASAPETPPEGRLPSDVRPTRYALTLAIDPSRERYTGVVEIDVELPRAQRTIYLHGEGLDVTEVQVSEAGRGPRAAEWASLGRGGLAAVSTPRPVGPGNVRLRIMYGAAFETTNRAFFRVTVDGEPYVFSQMEPLAARRSFPCFDEPSFKTPYDVTMVIREQDVAIANAREIASTPASGGMRRVRFATTQQIPSYLVAIAVGPFDLVEAEPMPPNEVRREPLALRAVAPRGQGAQLAHALEHTPRILTWLERYFGTRYPFDKLDLIAVPSFGGAMENPGAVTFSDRLLLLGDDPPISQQRGYAYVMAHELAHQWFGNLVTMQWWDDLWLNEAFASWMEAQTIAATFPQFEPGPTAMAEATRAMEADSLGSARQIRQPITSHHDIENAFDTITYLKGQSVLAMFEQWLTPEIFRRGVRSYLRDHAEGNATADDLLDALGAAAGRDVRGPLESFLTQPGVPRVAVTPQCDGGAARLALRQSRYLPRGSSARADRTWQIPLCVRYGVDGEVHRQCTLLTEVQGSLALEAGCPDWVLPNASGVGYYRWALPPDSLDALRRRGLPQLDVREAMSFADSVRASFAAGRTSYADAMRALQPLATRPERSLATAPMRLVELAIDHLLDDAEQGHARRWADDLYRGAWRRLGWHARDAEEPETQLYRRELATFLALVTKNRGIRREAAERGRAYLGGGRDAQIQADAVAPDLAALSVAVAVQEGDEALFEHTRDQLLRATDPVVRRNLLEGLSLGADEASRRSALFMLATDPEGGLRMNEIFAPFREQSRTASGRAAASAWVRTHYDQLFARLGPTVAGYLPYAAAEQCSDADADATHAFFAERMEATRGGPRNLATVVERIRICAALRRHARESAAEFFAR